MLEYSFLIKILVLLRSGHVLISSISPFQYLTNFGLLDYRSGPTSIETLSRCVVPGAFSMLRALLFFGTIHLLMGSQASGVF